MRKGNGCARHSITITSKRYRYVQQRLFWQWHCRAPAQRLGIQLPQARCIGLRQKQRSRARSGQLQCRVGRARGYDAAFQSVKPTALWQCTTNGFGCATRRALSRRNRASKRCVRRRVAPSRCRTAAWAGSTRAFRKARSIDVWVDRPVLARCALRDRPFLFAPRLLGEPGSAVHPRRWS